MSNSSVWPNDRTLSGDTLLARVDLGAMAMKGYCDNTHSRPPRTYQLLWNNFVLAGDSSSGFRRGISHFFLATRNTTEGVGEKEQTNNKGLGQLKVQEGGFCNSAFPVDL